MDLVKNFISGSAALLTVLSQAPIEGVAPATQIAMEAIEEAQNVPTPRPTLNLAKEGFMQEYASKDLLLPILKKTGIIEEDETLVALEDHDFRRGGAECYFSPFKVEVETGGEKKVKYGVVKAWLGSGKGRMTEVRRAHLISCGMNVLPQFGTLPSQIDPNEIQATFQYHIKPSAYEKGERVLEALDLAKELTAEQGAEAGRIAAILDANRYTPMRILSDILINDNNDLIFNDFGYDLGDPGPETERYFGCDVPIEYFHGIKALNRELRKNPIALEAAISAYSDRRGLAIEAVKKVLF